MKPFVQDYDPEEEDEDVEILTGWQAESQEPWRNSGCLWWVS